MSNSNDQPTTSKRQVVGGVNNEAASRKQIKRERVSKKEKRKIQGPRGEIEVDVNPGDTIVTTTRRDGTIIQSVEPASSNSPTTKPSTTKSSSSSRQKPQKLQKRMVPSTRKSSPDMSLHNRTLDLDLLRKSWDDFNVQPFGYKKTPYSHWYDQYKRSLIGNELGFSNEDLAFINDYINNENSLNEYYDANRRWIADPNDALANKRYDEAVAKRNELNIALAKKPNKNALYKVIWKGLSPYNTAERSAEDHKYINTINAGTSNEMGSMNWEAATGKKGPNFSVEDFTPEYNHWTAGFDDVTLRTPVSTPVSVPQPSNAVTLLVPKYSDRFKSQYDYAKTHNGAFDYSSNAFDLSGLVNNTNYGGIGDFMDAYGLNPQELYKMLENIYEPQ